LIAAVGPDLCGHIVSFFHERDVVGLLTVSFEFSKVVRKHLWKRLSVYVTQLLLMKFSCTFLGFDSTAAEVLSSVVRRINSLKSLEVSLYLRHCQHEIETVVGWFEDTLVVHKNSLTSLRLAVGCVRELHKLQESFLKNGFKTHI
jgi:hypothetical protein